MLQKYHWKTIVISDVHLGAKASRVKEVIRFLKANSCDKLIMNGDIIDGWQLKRRGEWKRKHTRFFRTVLKMMHTHHTEVIYVRGNHDDFLDQVVPMHIGRMAVVKEYLHESKSKKYWVIHGDVFDSITSHLRWIARLGDIGYTFLLWINKLYNARRRRKGLPYYSLSKMVKQKVKSAVSYISNFETELVSLARKKKYDGIICGHIHNAADVHYGNIHYLNSGDWVESLTALAEDEKGKWRIIYYDQLEDSKGSKQVEKENQAH
jgi:UDP-2,3-diacylglucosamine pyrophosphatase LpxH